MYRDFFSLDDYPFRLTADSHYFFASDEYMRAKAYLRYVLHVRDGVALITGVSGVGKTVMLEHVISELNEDIVVGRVHQTKLNTIEFLIAICLQFGIRPWKMTKAVLLDEIRNFCLQQHCEGKTVLLVVDEAHYLNMEILDEIAMLAKLEATGRKLCQVVLVGHPKIDEILTSHPENSLSQMIRLRCEINTLNIIEVEQYIAHRLSIASNGKHRNIIPKALLADVMAYTGGIPRLVNILVDMILIAACMRNTYFVDSDCLQAAIRKLKWLTYSNQITNDSESVSNYISVSNRSLPILEIYHENEFIGKFLVCRDRMTIGREKGQDIKLDHKKVSRQHAQILYVNGKYYLQDLKSMNGVRSESEKVKWHELSDQDRIFIGPYSIEFQRSDASQENSIEPKYLDDVSSESVSRLVGVTRR